MKFYPRTSRSSSHLRNKDFQLRSEPYLVPKLETKIEDEIRDILEERLDQVGEEFLAPEPVATDDEYEAVLEPLADERKLRKVSKRYRLGLYDCISSYCGDSEGEKRLSCISFYCHRD